MCLRRAPEKYIAGAKAPAGAALYRAGIEPSQSYIVSRQCGILNISQPYRPRRPVKGTALLLHFLHLLRWFNFLPNFPADKLSNSANQEVLLIRHRT
jgi:hypothetical protein